jgi:hypothetical protein
MDGEQGQLRYGWRDALASKITLVMLCLGIAGLVKMIVVGLFYDKITSSGLIEWIGPGTTLAKLTVLCWGAGLIGSVMFIQELISGNVRLAYCKTASIILYFALFMWAAWVWIDL